MSPVTTSLWAQRWAAFSAACVRSFHTYANWLVGISWLRFVLLSALLLVAVGILQNVPPFRWKYTETVSRDADEPVKPPKPPAPPKAPAAPKPPVEPKTGTQTEPRRSEPAIKIERPKPGSKTEGVEIVIDERGIRITPKPAASSPLTSASSVAGADVPATAAANAAADASAAARGTTPEKNAPIVDIRLPQGATSETVREAVAEARKAIEAAVREAREEAAEAARSAAEDAREAVAQAAQDAAEAARDVAEARGQRRRSQTRVVSLGDALPELALLWILASVVIKITYKRQIQAEAQAAQAVETAEAESLKRQVVEARMAAMQAQIEPHFLFNTLASIDHLIEVDPQRASVMQKNLIALLRASMPTMREAGDGAARDLGRELSVIRPYLEILKVRMEERLTTEINVPEGLLSAEFPQMMVQTLVENAIKHGLEPKPEGGRLLVKAEIVHGKLCVTVADSGLGFGRAATAGTGVGLANIRERLQLLYGAKAALTISENPGGGTVVSVSVPYKPLHGDSA